MVIDPKPPCKANILGSICLVICRDDPKVSFSFSMVSIIGLVSSTPETMTAYSLALTPNCCKASEIL